MGKFVQKRDKKMQNIKMGNGIINRDRDFCMVKVS